MRLRFSYDYILLSVLEILCMHSYLRPLGARLRSPLPALLLMALQCGLCLLTNCLFFGRLSLLTAAAYFLFVLLFVYTDYRADIKTAVFQMLILLLSGHCLKQICFNLPRFVASLVSSASISGELLFFGAWLLFGLLYFFALFLIRKALSRTDPSLLSWGDVSCMAITTFPVMLISYLPIFADMSGVRAYYLLAEFFASVCGLFLVVWICRARQGMQARLELAELRLAMENQYAQFVVREECAKKINQSYHDIRNQLLAFRTESAQGEVEDYLKELDRTIQQYEATYHTGNSVVDSMLYEKSKRCLEGNIQLVCMANGRLLEWMSAMDICGLLGNMLDNAIEAVEALPPQERSILLKLTEYRNYTVLRCENSYTGELKGGLEGAFLSSKGRDRGYGLRGIRSIAEKYGGNMSVIAENGRFVLSILLPTT